MSVNFGLVLPSGPRKLHVQAWLDDLDTYLPGLAGHFKSIWMTDHFFWHDEPTYEAWTVMAFAAARWPQFQIGPMVLGQSYRNPALLAKMGATLQTLSRGRFIMAVGAGWKEDEYHAYGYAYPAPSVRIEQLEDTLEIVTRMWTEPGPVSYHGRHYHIVNAYCEPRPDPVPTIIVGGGGQKTMALAVRYADWWNLPDAQAAVYAQRLTTLKELCEKAGRDLDSLRLTWFGRIAVAESEAAAVALSDGRWTRQNAVVGTPAQVIEQLQEFKALGVSYFMTEVLDITSAETRAAVDEVLSRIG
jgi:alkanesulfonate monooxygenase SsuD/methylene tetrahydromethanopterin reductase-like flavin-dependent oxidoreductase (luciferase family)